MNTRKIALSLPYSYLAGHIVSKRDSILLELFGPAANFLPEMGNQLSGIEISNFNDTAPADQVISVVRTIRKAGLEVILHAHLPAVVSDIAGMESIYPWMNTVMDEAAAGHQSLLLLNLHTLSSGSLDIPTLIEKTIENLNRILGILKTSSLPIKIAMELNREKGEIDPSTTYENLITICNRIDSESVGIGWDLGHTYSNVLNGFIPQEPPQEFIERVIHTHIHDLGRDNQTHWPLTMGTLPLDFYMEKLQSVNYGGYYTLEIYPGRFYDVLPAREKMLESIEILRRT